MQTQTGRHHLRIFIDICMLKGSYLSSQVDLCTSCPSLAPHIIAPLWRQPHTGVGGILVKSTLINLNSEIEAVVIIIVH